MVQKSAFSAYLSLESERDVGLECGHKIHVQRIPTKRKGPSDDDDDEEDEDEDDGDDDDDDFSDSRSNRLLVIPPFSFLRYGQTGI